MLKNCEVTYFWVTPLIGFIFWRCYLLFTSLKTAWHLPSYTRFSVLSALPYILRVYYGEPFRTRSLEAKHQSHDVIQLTPNHWSFKSPKAVSDIYGHSSVCGKGDLYTMTAGSHYHVLNTPDQIEHRVKRKRLASAFAMKNLLNWETKVVDKVTRLISQLDRRCRSGYSFGADIPAGGGFNVSKNEYVDLRLWFNLFTVEAIADIAASQKLSIIEQGADSVTALTESGRLYKTSYTTALRGIGRSSIPFVFVDNLSFHYLKVLLGFWSTKFSEERSNSEKFGDIVRWVASQRIERGQKDKDEPLDDFMSCLLGGQAGNGVPDIEQGEILAELSMFMDAGSDTTAIALTHVVWLLAQHPAKLKKLREEIAPHFRETDDEKMEVPSYTALSGCLYLRACLNEALRLYPPVATGLQRKPPAGGALIDGQYVPENVNVSAPAYVVHRNPDIFPQPNDFLPERWMPQACIGNNSATQANFIAFSTGPRGCLGRNITYIEQTLLIAVVAHRYDFELAPYPWRMTWEEKFNLWPTDLPVKLIRRFSA